MSVCKVSGISSKERKKWGSNRTIQRYLRHTMQFHEQENRQIKFASSMNGGFLPRFQKDELTCRSQICWSASSSVPYVPVQQRRPDLRADTEVHRLSDNSRRQPWCNGVRSLRSRTRPVLLHHLNQTVQIGVQFLPVLGVKTPPQ